jgi:hypothetical protein
MNTPNLCKGKFMIYIVNHVIMAYNFCKCEIS